MNIRYLKNKEIDKRKWNEKIYSFNNALIYGCSWYLDIVCDSWDAIIVDDYDVLLPLSIKKNYGLKVVNVPDFVHRHNIYSAKSLSEEKILEILNFAKKNFFAFTLKLDDFDFQNKNYKIEQNIRQYLIINDSWENQRKIYTKNAKKNIKKAINKNVTVCESVDFNNPIIMKKKVHQIKNLSYSPKIYYKLENIIKYNLKNYKGEIFDAYIDEQLIASAFFAKFKNIYTIFSGNSEIARKTGAGYLLIDKFIEKHSNENVILDFAGSNIEGIAKRNLSFGSKSTNFYQVSNSNFIYSLFKK